MPSTLPRSAIGLMVHIYAKLPNRRETPPKELTDSLTFRADPKSSGASLLDHPVALNSRLQIVDYVQVLLLLLKGLVSILNLMFTLY